MAVPMRCWANVDDVPIVLLCMALVSRLAVPLDNADGGRVDIGRADASPLQKYIDFYVEANHQRSHPWINVTPNLIEVPGRGPFVPYGSAVAIFLWSPRLETGRCNCCDSSIHLWHYCWIAENEQQQQKLVRNSETKLKKKSNQFLLTISANTTISIVTAYGKPKRDQPNYNVNMKRALRVQLFTIYRWFEIAFNVTLRIGLATSRWATLKRILWEFIDVLIMFACLFS